MVGIGSQQTEMEGDGKWLSWAQRLLRPYASFRKSPLLMGSSESPRVSRFLFPGRALWALGLLCCGLLRPPSLGPSIWAALVQKVEEGPQPAALIPKHSLSCRSASGPSSSAREPEAGGSLLVKTGFTYGEPGEVPRAKSLRF